jgi:hypothetical protein
VSEVKLASSRQMDMSIATGTARAILGRRCAAMRTKTTHPHRTARTIGGSSVFCAVQTNTHILLTTSLLGVLLKIRNNLYAVSGKRYGC